MNRVGILFFYFVFMPLSWAAGPVLSVACLGSDGQVKNASDADVCKIILPKCSDVQAVIQKSAKRMLSMKIYGYYKGKDLDLDKSSKDHLVGTDLAIPVCSVVGHNIAGSGDEEMVSQTVGNKSSCGRRPYATGARGSKRVYLRFQNDEGTLWSSWMLGTYPWGIRANAYDFFKAIQPDLSNLDSLLTSSVASSLKNDYIAVADDAKAYFRKLDDSSKSMCTSNKTDIVDKCMNGGFSFSDPAIRLCTLVKAQKALNEGALGNLVVAEVMSKVQAQHDSLFKNVMTANVRPGSGDPGFMNQLIYKCNRGTGDLNGGSRRKKLAKVASCIFSGEEFRCWKDWHIDEGSLSSNKTGQRSSHFDLSNGQVHTDSGTNANRSLQNGFAGGIEYTIRNNICGQTTRGMPADKCDSSDSGIPDKPSDLSW
jgi:hypothetical protein